jgi:hypothetical protein
VTESFFLKTGVSMNSSSESPTQSTILAVEPGVCGFHCTIEAIKTKDDKVQITISDSQCELVQLMSEFTEELTIKDLFLPMAKNPITQWAEKARCHPSCIVPFAILKAVEVEMGMALPRRAGIEFRQQEIQGRP